MHYDIPKIDFLFFLVAENRREKSLALLTQNFVKLFVCSKVNVTISFLEDLEMMYFSAKARVIFMFFNNHFSGGSDLP